MPTDPALSLRRSQADPEAFTDFYRDRYEAIVAYFARRVYDPDVALELTAETFAQAYSARRKFRGSTRPEAEAWIFRIAERKLSRYVRRGEVERRAMRKLRIEAPSVDAERRARVSELADLAGVRTVVAAELTRLSTPQREALRMRVVDDLAYADIARSLQISESAARARVSRALRALARALDGNPSIEELSR